MHHSPEASLHSIDPSNPVVSVIVPDVGEMPDVLQGNVAVQVGDTQPVLPDHDGHSLSAQVILGLLGLGGGSSARLSDIVAGVAAVLPPGATTSAIRAAAGDAIRDLRRAGILTSRPRGGRVWAVAIDGAAKEPDGIEKIPARARRPVKTHEVTKDYGSIAKYFVANTGCAVSRTELLRITRSKSGRKDAQLDRAIDSVRANSENDGRFFTARCNNEVYYCLFATSLPPSDQEQVVTGAVLAHMTKDILQEISRPVPFKNVLQLLQERLGKSVAPQALLGLLPSISTHAKTRGDVFVDEIVTDFRGKRVRMLHYRPATDEEMQTTDSAETS